MALKDRLKSERIALELSQQALADRAGVSQQLIGRLETGGVVETAKLVQIAAALDGLDPRWLATGQGQKRGAAGPSHSATLDPARLDVVTDFLDDLFESYGRVFERRGNSMLIAEVYDDLSKPVPLNLVALTKKYGPRIGGEKNERQDKAGSVGKNDRGAARERAKKA